MGEDSGAELTQQDRCLVDNPNRKEMQSLAGASIGYIVAVAGAAGCLGGWVNLWLTLAGGGLWKDLHNHRGTLSNPGSNPCVGLGSEAACLDGVRW